MKTRIKNILRLSLSLLAVVSIILMTAPARATFIVDPDPGGTKFFLGEADHDINQFTGNVGENGEGPLVEVQSVGNVDIGSGYATIKPANESTLTSLIFTPTGDTKFGDFSFEGQMNGTGDVSIRVIDQAGVVFLFNFFIDQADRLFDRIGVVSNDGEWIRSVEILTAVTGGFKEVKHIDFSEQANPIPEPSTFTLLSAGIIGVTLLRRRAKA